MTISLTQILIALSYAIDLVEIDLLGIVSNHSKRVAYISTKIAERLGLALPEVFGVLSLALLHDVGYATKGKIGEFVEGFSGSLFHPDVAAAFLEAAGYPHFWLDLRDEFLGASVRDGSPPSSLELTYDQVREITKAFSRIIDSKSKFTVTHSQHLSEKSGTLAARCGFSAPEIAQMRIAADLHDIGKFAISNDILDSPVRLDPAGLDVVRRHTYYTRANLQGIEGFENITEWASNHHERLDGLGYPYGKSARDLDAGSRLLACLDKYQALTEGRPYRSALPHDDAVRELRRLGTEGAIDASMVEEIAAAFG